MRFVASKMKLTRDSLMSAMTGNKRSRRRSLVLRPRTRPLKLQEPKENSRFALSKRFSVLVWQRASFPTISSTACALSNNKIIFGATGLRINCRLTTKNGSIKRLARSS